MPYNDWRPPAIGNHAPIFSRLPLVKGLTMTRNSLFAVTTLTALGLAATIPAHAQTLTLNTGDVITVNGNGTSGHIGATVFMPPNGNTTFDNTPISGAPYTITTNGTSTFTLGAGGVIKGQGVGIALSNSSTVTITGGTVTEIQNGTGVSSNSTGLLSISGGTITGGVNGIGVRALTSGPVTVTGGTITAPGGNYAFLKSGSGLLTVTGGTITGGLYGLYADGGPATVTGGLFGGTTYALFTNTGTIDLYGNFSSLSTGQTLTVGQATNLNLGAGSFVGTLSNNASGQTFTYFNNNRITLHDLASTPEPSQWAAFAVGVLGLGGLAFRARLRRA